MFEYFTATAQPQTVPVYEPQQAIETIDYL